LIGFALFAFAAMDWLLIAWKGKCSALELGALLHLMTS